MVCAGMSALLVTLIGGVYSLVGCSLHPAAIRDWRLDKITVCGQLEIHLQHDVPRQQTRMATSGRRSTESPGFMPPCRQAVPWDATHGTQPMSRPFAGLRPSASLYWLYSSGQRHCSARESGFVRELNLCDILQDRVQHLRRYHMTAEPWQQVAVRATSAECVAMLPSKAANAGAGLRHMRLQDMPPAKNGPAMMSPLAAPVACSSPRPP